MAAHRESAADCSMREAVPTAAVAVAGALVAVVAAAAAAGALVAVAVVVAASAELERRTVELGSPASARYTWED